VTVLTVLGTPIALSNSIRFVLLYTGEAKKVVGLELRIRIRPDKRTEFLQMREMLQRKTQPEGCVDQKIYEEVDGSNRFLWSERWRSRDPLEEYMKSEDFRMLLGAIEVLGELEDQRTIEIS
jgi:quinol monooxygenase YgiN